MLLAGEMMEWKNSQHMRNGCCQAQAGDRCVNIVHTSAEGKQHAALLRD